MNYNQFTDINILKYNCEEFTNFIKNNEINEKNLIDILDDNEELFKLIHTEKELGYIKDMFTEKTYLTFFRKVHGKRRGHNL